MNLQLNHNSNYFLDAQLIVRHIQDKLFEEKTEYIYLPLPEFKRS